MVFFNYLNKSEIGTSFVCLVQSTISSLLHKSNTIYLSKEATNKDKNLKTQLSLSTETGDEKSADTEKIWDKPGFFGDQVADFTNNKVNFQKNTLVYANQGDLAVYLDYVILGQLIPAMNSPENIDEYESLPNEVKMVILLYNAYSGEFLGLEKRLAFILVRGDQMRHFFLTVTIKANRQNFIPPPKNHYRIYLAAPVSRTIRNFQLSIDLGKKIPPFFST